MKKWINIILPGFLILFGAITVFLAASIILDLFGIRAKEGNYVSIVVWANLFAGSLYLLAAIFILRNNNYAARILWLAVVILLMAAAGFWWHVFTGGIYETKTIYALFFRTAVTILAAWSAGKLIKNNIHEAD